MKSKVESRVVSRNPNRVSREKGESGKRLWTRDLASAVMGRYKGDDTLKGLLYWSAYDFIHRKRKDE